jgi:hypothetical protein
MLRLALTLGCTWGDAAPAEPAPLPPPEAWAGSAACAGCHPAVAAEWSASWHARTVRPASTDDLEQLAGLLDCGDLDATAVLGGRHELRWLVEDDGTPFGAGRWLALPCGWDAGDDAPTTHHEDAWRTRPFEQTCAACHVTGFRGAEGGWAEPGVGCEACHGPGAEHARTGDPARIVTFPAADEVTVCASCHLQGATSARTGRHVPDRYVPGRPLFDDWTFDWATLDPGGPPLDVHQKALIRSHREGAAGMPVCTSCHAMHSLGHDRHAAVPRGAVCDGCHEPDLKLKEYEQSCAVCEF